MEKLKNSVVSAPLLHRRDFAKKQRVTSKGAGQIKDSIAGIMLDMMEGHEGEFVPISIHDVRLQLRQDYDIFSTYRQVGYYTLQLVKEGFFEKELHHIDRTARHWSDQYSRYRLRQ
ncbi:hypothetical protein ES703_65534 [subsurface metagenome]